jgi:hypothetical protein
MPTTTRSRTTQKHSSVLEQDPGLEALGAGLAPGLPGVEWSEPVGRAQRGGVPDMTFEIGGESPDLGPC